MFINIGAFYLKVYLLQLLWLLPQQTEHEDLEIISYSAIGVICLIMIYLIPTIVTQLKIY